MQGPPQPLLLLVRLPSREPHQPAANPIIVACPGSGGISTPATVPPLRVCSCVSPESTRVLSWHSLHHELSATAFSPATASCHQDNNIIGHRSFSLSGRPPPSSRGLLHSPPRPTPPGLWGRPDHIRGGVLYGRLSSHRVRLCFVAPSAELAGCLAVNCSLAFSTDLLIV